MEEGGGVTLYFCSVLMNQTIQNYCSNLHLSRFVCDLKARSSALAELVSFRCHCKYYKTLVYIYLLAYTSSKENMPQISQRIV